MNAEVMALYKAKGVNPASGCVPMLLTLPFLFAFYSMLSQAIEIRGARLRRLDHDLSAPDPLLRHCRSLMGVDACSGSSKMTPTTADPAQQKIMMFMPLMFTVMSFSFPSGLVIYWLVSNAVGHRPAVLHQLSDWRCRRRRCCKIGRSNDDRRHRANVMATADITEFVQKSSTRWTSTSRPSRRRCRTASAST